METATISPELQVVIPRRIRESPGLKPGQKVRVMQLGQRVKFWRKP